MKDLLNALIVILVINIGGIIFSYVFDVSKNEAMLYILVGIVAAILTRGSSSNE